MKTKYNKEIANNLVRKKLGFDDIDENMLHKWSESNKYAAKTMARLDDDKWIAENLSQFGESDKAKEFSRLISYWDKQNSRRRLFKLVSSVAAAVLFVSMLVYYVGLKKEDIVIVAEGKFVETNILKPTLIADNTYIELSEEQQKQEMVRVTDLAPNHTYSKVSQETEKPVLQRFVVPAKYTSQIELSDGTVVHLNANSELQFPDDFEGDTARRVRLKGEGYFDVTKSDKRFIVSVGDTEVEVYGTRFNINAYTSGSTKTVLVEGSVMVKHKNKQIMMQPNELCEVNNMTGELVKCEVRVDQYVAWVDNQLMSENDSFENLLIKLSAWYDTEFILNDTSIKDETVTVIIPNHYSIDDVIDVIKLSGIQAEFEKTERGYIIR